MSIACIFHQCEANKNDMTDMQSADPIRELIVSFSYAEDNRRLCSMKEGKMLLGMVSNVP